MLDKRGTAALVCGLKGVFVPLVLNRSPHLPLPLPVSQAEHRGMDHRCTSRDDAPGRGTILFDLESS